MSIEGRVFLVMLSIAVVSFLVGKWMSDDHRYHEGYEDAMDDVLDFIVDLGHTNVGARVIERFGAP